MLLEVKKTTNMGDMYVLASI